MTPSVCVWFFFGTSVVSLVTGLISVPYMDYAAYVKRGNINIGAIIPIHQFNLTAPCGGALRELGVLQRMEAMVFAIEEINNRTDILPNITLGYVILDDCYKESTAVGRALQFVTTKDSCSSANVTSSDSCGNDTKSYDVIGIIGSESSSTSMSIAHISTLYKMPQLSYLATSPELDSSQRFPLFYRTVPSDYHQAAALVDFLAHSNWTYVSILYSDSSYGTAGYKALQDIAPDKGICFAYAQAVQYSSSKTYFNKIIHKLAKFQTMAKVVIVYTPLELAREILSAAKRNNHKETFTWMSSDAWGRNIQDYDGLEEVAWGIIAVKVNSLNVPRFDNYFANLVPSVKTANPWFQEFWDDVFNCSSGVCSAADRFPMNSYYTPDTLTSLVIDAVYTYAYALDDVIITNCSANKASCYLNSCIDADVLTAAFENVSFKGELVNFTFDSYGNGILNYTFQSLQKVGDNYTLVHVATWGRTAGLVFDGAPLQFKNFSTIPKSVCSDPCEFGYSQEVVDFRCCWTCAPCRPNEISVVVEGIMKCSRCLNNTWPDSTRSVCLELAPKYLSYSSVLGGCLLAAASLGIIATIVIAVIYAVNSKHKLIKASGRELSYVMLFGIWLHYSAVFICILEPTDLTCVVNLWTFSLSFCMVYAPLLTKSNRIYRIFESGLQGKIRPALIDSKSQLLITVILVIFQILILIVWIFIDTPQAIAQLGKDNNLALFCSTSLVAVGTSLGYNMLLILACCFHAFKTRKLPTNFNESRFISFCVYTTIVMWLAFFPAYVTLAYGYYRNLFSCLALLINATVFIVCLYGTRIYGVYFVKKVDLHVMSTASRSSRAGFKCAANAVRVAINLPGPKISARPESEQDENKDDFLNPSVETQETSNSDLDHVQVQTVEESVATSGECVYGVGTHGGKTTNDQLAPPDGESSVTRRTISLSVI